MRGFNYKKAVQALNYLAFKTNGKINKMKAIKLIWLSDRLHLRLYGRSIIGDQYFAMPFGPVPSSTRDILEGSTFLSEEESSYSCEYLSPDKYEVLSKKEPDLQVFSKTDIDAINKIFDNYSSLNQFQLSDLSHTFPEWKRFESVLEKKISSREEMDYLDFFINVDDKTGLFVDDEEGLELSKAIFAQNNKAKVIL